MSVDLGSYNFAFFKMKVNIDGDINLNTLSPKDFSVFLHEYIHFIQDFTTTSGCRRIYVYGEFVRQCIMQISSGHKKFSVPISIPEYENNVMPNYVLMNKVEGDKTNMSVVKIKKIETDLNNIFDKNGNSLSFDTLIVETIGDMPISVGSHAIKESMAYLVEQLCSSDYEKSPDFPYNITRIISDFMLGENKLDNMELLALCDVSLLTSNPGLSFYRFLCMIHDGALIVNKPEDIYDYFYQSRSIKYESGQIVPSITDYLQNAYLALDALKKYYELEVLRDLNDWLDNVFACGTFFRTQQPYFMIDMARNAKDKNNSVLRFFAKVIGSPLIENNQGQMFKLQIQGGEPPTEYLYVLEQIFLLFKKGEKTCALKSWCSKKVGQLEAPADTRCDTAPWSRCRDKNLCPYALFWYHRKLSDYTPL